MTWKLLKLVLFGVSCRECCKGRLRLCLVLAQMWEADFWEAHFVCNRCGCVWRRIER